MKRIIVEGMDSTGKSTLIKTLCDQFHNLRVVVNEKGPDQDFNLWLPTIVFDGMIQPPYVPIHDRFFYSELIYGEHLRGRINIAPTVMQNIRNHLRQNAMLIYCRPSVLAMEKTFDNKDQMPGVAKNFHKLVRAYDDMLFEESYNYGIRYTSYNWETEDPRLIIARVERYLMG